MSYSKCPKCGKLNESNEECYFCGILFGRYSELRLKRLNEINTKLQNLEFNEATSLCNKLFISYPEHRKEDSLLSEKINSESEILEKYLLAKDNIDLNNYTAAVDILENLRSSINNLQSSIVLLYNEGVDFINKQNENKENIEFINLAENEISNGNIPSARVYLEKVNDNYYTDRVNDLNSKILHIRDQNLAEAISSFRKKKFEESEKKFDYLNSTFPETAKDIQTYLQFLKERNKIKDNLFQSALNAKKEGRLFESKVLFFFLGMQFPNLISNIQPIIQEIGPGVTICLADLSVNGIFDFAALGVDISGDRLIDFVSGIADTNGDGLVDVASTLVDINGDGLVDVASTSVDINGDGLVDVASTSVDTNGDGLADVTTTAIDFISSIFS